MQFEEYEKTVTERAFYPGRHTMIGLMYTGLGIGGESGEALEQIKKCVRDDDAVLKKGRKEKLLHELGDVLWYVTAAAQEAGSSLEEVAKLNVKKLKKRSAKTGKATKG